jgi:hypothetical protein
VLYLQCHQNMIEPVLPQPWEYYFVRRIADPSREVNDRSRNQNRRRSLSLRLLQLLVSGLITDVAACRKAANSAAQPFMPFAISSGLRCTRVVEVSVARDRHPTSPPAPFGSSPNGPSDCKKDISDHGWHIDMKMPRWGSCNTGCARGSHANLYHAIKDHDSFLSGFNRGV